MVEDDHGRGGGRDRQVGAAGDDRTALPSCPGGSKRIQVGGITLAIVLLIPRAGPAWLAAFHRFVEVSIGIGVALTLTVVWLEREAAPFAGARQGFTTEGRRRSR